MACTTHRGYRESMSSGIFPLSFWITFCFGFNSGSFDEEGELKKISNDQVVCFDNKAISTELLSYVVVSPPQCPNLWCLLITL